MLPSGLPDTVGDGEDLARFLTQSSQYSSNGVKPGAFLPHPQTQDASVSRHGAAPLDTLRQLGIAAANGRALHGAAIIKAGIVRRVGLTVDSDEPPQRHALIHSWPRVPSDPELQKAKQRDLALTLASEAGFAVLLR